MPINDRCFIRISSTIIMGRICKKRGFLKAMEIFIFLLTSKRWLIFDPDKQWVNNQIIRYDSLNFPKKNQLI